MREIREIIYKLQNFKILDACVSEDQELIQDTVTYLEELSQRRTRDREERREVEGLLELVRQ